MILGLGEFFLAHEVPWCLHWLCRYRNGAKLRHLPGVEFLNTHPTPVTRPDPMAFTSAFTSLDSQCWLGWLDAESPWKPWCWETILSFLLGIWRTYFVFSGFCCSIFGGVNAHWQISSKISYILSNSSKIIFIHSWCLTRLKVAMVVKVINVNRHWLVLKPIPTSFLVAPSTRKKHSNQCYYNYWSHLKLHGKFIAFNWIHGKIYQLYQILPNPNEFQLWLCDVVYVVCIPSNFSLEFDHQQ